MGSVRRRSCCAVLLVLGLCAPASSFARRPAHRPSPQAEAPAPDAAERRAAVRQALDEGDADRARALATRGLSTGKIAKDRELVALLGEAETLAGHFPEAARRLAAAAPEDRRSAWLGTLAALA